VPAAQQQPWTHRAAPPHCAAACFQELPAELCRLTHLKILRLNNNKLRQLPAELAGASALIELHAGFNQITALPTGECAAPPPRPPGSNPPPSRALTADRQAALLPSGADRRLRPGLRFACDGKAGDAARLLTPACCHATAGLGRLVHLRALVLKNNLLDEFPEVGLGWGGGVGGGGRLPAVLSSLAHTWQASRACRGAQDACGLELQLLDLSDNSLRALPARLGLMTSLRS